MTYREAMSLGGQALEGVGIADAKNDAWLLLAMACKIDRTYYFSHMDTEMSAEQTQEYSSLLKKRAEHIPLQYITGEQDFMGLTFSVNSSVLIPRQDTESLVEAALRCIAPGMKVMDMCTGSGCILISVLKLSSNVTGFGYDNSKQALGVAKDNAKRNGVTAIFEHSDLFADVQERDFDMIICNPPYIRTDEIAHLMPEVSQFEPGEALDGHEDGLYFYRKITEAAPEFLKPDGMLFFEIGYDQGSDVPLIMEKSGFSDVKIKKDLAGNNRVASGRWNPEVL
ncbi:MAG: peptide chain release factor N(5)-glutamine methyltransferase [Clostridiales bacterium]|nr:peptide chain release factor N(5)-glutamine methyltransferase [Clostridiales bacterium]